MGGSASKQKNTSLEDVQDIDLTGYLNYKKITASYDPVIPKNAYGKLSNLATFTAHLNIDRLPQTHVYDVLQQKYSLEYETSYSDNIVNLESIVAKLHQNIVAISRGKGEPIATGLLIAPHLVLTARHCIEELKIKSLIIRQSYEKNASGMSYGIQISVDGYVEENTDLDYVILQLNQSVAHFSSVKLNLSDELDDPSILIHHPTGGPKKISVHAVPQSDHYQLIYNAFHDSQKGSSGGIYINASAEVCALHMLRSPSGGAWTTGARKISDIFNSSTIFQNLYNRGGYFNSQPMRLYRPSTSTLSFALISFREWLERVTRPIGLPTLNTTPGAINLAYHHIIPIGDMEFLWMLGKENPKIERMLRDNNLYCPSNDAIKDGQLNINAVAWTTWNLIIGPQDRFDDPKNGNIMEQHKPENFPKKLWDAIEGLSKSIHLAWDIRSSINNSTSFRTDTIAMLDECDEMYALPQGTLTNQSSSIIQYAASNKKILNDLKNINGILNELKIKNKLYSYNANEWVETTKNEILEYALKGSKEALEEEARIKASRNTFSNRR